MIVKRKLDGAVDESSANQEINVIQLYITCEKFGGLQLAKPAFIAGRQ